MLVHKITNGPFATDKADDLVVECLAQFDKEANQFELVQITGSFNHVYKLVQHMHRPTLEPFNLEEFSKCTLQ